MKRAALIGLCGFAILAGLYLWRHVPQTLSHGRFEQVTLFAPQQTPRGFVLLLSDAGGWNADLNGIARQLARQGALVAGIDLARFAAQLEADGGDCVFPDGDLENLSHFVQAYFRLPAYLPPIIAGRGAGGTLAYATLAQAPANTFGGAVSLGFCPGLALRKPLCRSGALNFTATAGGVEFLPAGKLEAPWIAVQATGAGIGAPSCDAAAVERFVAEVPGARLIGGPQGALDPGGAPAYAEAFDELLRRNAAPAAPAVPAALADLPIIVVPAEGGAARADTFAIMLSGDGGWAGLDKEVAAALDAGGIPVIGLDSLRYFWVPRTPRGLAADLDRVIRYYATALERPRVILIGYSQGADVLPFAVNRLAAETRSHVALAAVMGLSEHALFEFHLTSWVSDDNSGPATLPEVLRITDVPVLCIYGADESDSLCPELDAHKVTIVKLKGGHHFDGDYDALAHAVIAAANGGRL